MNKLQHEEDKYEESSAENTSNSEESHVKFLFRSALDVGSTFLKIEPEDDDIQFHQTKSGTMMGQVYLENMTPGAPIAYYGWSSHAIEMRIKPQYGFIRPGEFQYVDFELMTDDPEKVDKGLYFIKALPLADTLDLEELEENIDEVFHEHNQRILFTLATLSGEGNLEHMADEVELDYHVDRDNIIYTQKYKEQVEKEKRLNENLPSATKQGHQQEALVKPEADASVPDIEETRSQPRESDLLGLNDPSKEDDSAKQSKFSFVNSCSHSN